jgi:orotate phosphoribosyltransferase
VSDSTLQTFRETGAYLKGHFRLTSGLHSGEYLQSALVLQHPDLAERLGRELAQSMPKGQVVVSPALGGLIIGHEVARAMDARFLFTERGPDGKMTLRRGFSLTPGETAVVIEDVITTGGSTREVIELLRAARAALATLDAVSWTPDECPLCKQGLPVVKPGSRATV